MNKNFLNVNNIRDYSTLSHKQIRNNINGLKKLSQFNDLIFGGGKGKGGQFWCHYTLVPYISNRQRNRVNKNIQTTIKGRDFSEFYYSKTSWDYFGCIHPNRDIDFLELTNSLKNFNSFYVIHRQKEKNHIHFTLQSSLKVPEIKEQLKSYFNHINISIDDIFLTEFDTNFKDNTLNYLLRRGNHSSKSDVIDWGLSSPSFQLD
jgi:hypothetical protein